MWKVSAERTMKMKRLSSIYLPLGIGALLAAALAPGCTTHGEGGRCDPANINQTTNLNADCDSNLVCTSGTVLSLPEGGTVTGWVCCPADRSTATTDICRGNPISPGSEAGIPEAGAETGTNDATVDQSTSDVVTDSPTSDVQTDSATTDAAGD
jgi:hypothetical protein